MRAKRMLVFRASKENVVLRSSWIGRTAPLPLGLALLVHCSTNASELGGAPGDTADAGDTASQGDAGKKAGGKKDGGAGGTDAGADDGSVGDDGGAGDDGSSSVGCGAWGTGTLSGYNNSNFADDPNAGSVMEFTGLTDGFYNNVAIASVDMSDWSQDKYHWVDIKYNGQIGRVGVWDACLNADCPGGTNCCTENKQKFAQPGYLLDVETRTANRLWGVTNAENTLLDKIEYRVCGSFDPDAIAAQYGAKRN